MNDVFVKDVVYDTISHCFMNLMYSTRTKANNYILDSIGFLPIRESEDGTSVNIYKLKNSNVVIKISFNEDDYKSIEDYKYAIDRILAENSRSRDELILIKKIVSKKLYKKCTKLAKTREHYKLLDIYGWGKESN